MGFTYYSPGAVDARVVILVEGFADIPYVFEEYFLLHRFEGLIELSVEQVEHRIRCYENGEVPT